MTDHELCWLGATELASLLRARKVSPVEVVEALLARIDVLNGPLRAYVHVCREQALAAARAAELELGVGIDRGPLHGIPVAYKDIYDVRGVPTTAASRLLLGNVASADSTVAARLRQAGAICLGKLNTFEFASGSMEVFGPARNPWNSTVVPGGSSAGSGVALAAHLIPLATGSDTGGSVRIPASFCGVVGLRPTYGRVSRAGIIPLSWSLDHAGPMARTVADTALLAAGDGRSRSARHDGGGPTSAGVRSHRRQISPARGSACRAPTSSRGRTRRSWPPWTPPSTPCGGSGPLCVRSIFRTPSTGPRPPGRLPTRRHSPTTGPASSRGRATTRRPFCTRSPGGALLTRRGADHRSADAPGDHRRVPRGAGRCGRARDPDDAVPGATRSTPRLRRRHAQPGPAGQPDGASRAGAAVWIHPGSTCRSASS